MAAFAASAPPCGSAFTASASSCRSSRRALLGRALMVPSSPGSNRYLPLVVRATTSTEEPATTTISSTPTRPISTITTEGITTKETTTEGITTEETATLQSDELIADLKARWDAIENKTNVFIYGGGALVALWLSATIVGAVNAVPLLPKILELVGLGYSGWFVYRYLLFKESRKQLLVEIEDLKSKVTGVAKEVVEEGLE